MSRNLTGPVNTAIQAERVMRTCAAELAFSSGVVRVSGAPIDLVFGGATFLGVGGLGGISAVQESTELRSYGLTLTLAGIPRDTIALAMGEHYQGRPGTVWEVVLDATTHRPLADPIVVFRGRMDQMIVKLGESATVGITMTNRLADWDRPRLRRYTDEDQRRAFPADDGFRFVSATADKELVWPAKGFTGRSGPSAGGGNLGDVVRGVMG